MTILLSTSRQLPWKVAADTLSEFSQTNIKNALAKHLANDHPDKEGDQSVFKYL